MRIIDTITSTSDTITGPIEPVLFTSCDGPHCGVPDEQRPPHWLDVIEASLLSSRDRGADYAQDVATFIAEGWAAYGFTAADLAAWTGAGITEPAVAAECRTEGFDPDKDRHFFTAESGLAGLPGTIAELLIDGDITAEQARHLYRSEAWAQ